MPVAHTPFFANPRTVRDRTETFFSGFLSVPVTQTPLPALAQADLLGARGGSRTVRPAASPRRVMPERVIWTLCL